MPASKPTEGDTTKIDATKAEAPKKETPTGGPYDLVRVKHKDGRESTVKRVIATQQGLTVLDKPATDRNGWALPSKPHTDLTGTTKEN